MRLSDYFPLFRRMQRVLDCDSILDSLICKYGYLRARDLLFYVRCLVV